MSQGGKDMMFYNRDEFEKFVSKVKDDDLALEHKCLHYVLDTDEVKDSIFIDAYLYMNYVIENEMKNRFLKSLVNKKTKIASFKTI